MELFDGDRTVGHERLIRPVEARCQRAARAKAERVLHAAAHVDLGLQLHRRVHVPDRQPVGGFAAELVVAKIQIELQAVDRARKQLLFHAAYAGGRRDGQEPGQAVGAGCPAPRTTGAEEGPGRTERAAKDVGSWRETGRRVTLVGVCRCQARLVIDVEERRIRAQAMLEEVAFVADLVLDGLLARYLPELSGREDARVEAGRAETRCDRAVEQHVLGGLKIDAAAVVGAALRDGDRKWQDDRLRWNLIDVGEGIGLILVRVAHPRRDRPMIGKFVLRMQERRFVLVGVEVVRDEVPQQTAVCESIEIGRVVGTVA